METSFLWPSGDAVDAACYPSNVTSITDQAESSWLDLLHGTNLIERRRDADTQFRRQNCMQESRQMKNDRDASDESVRLAKFGLMSRVDGWIGLHGICNVWRTRRLSDISDREEKRERERVSSHEECAGRGDSALRWLNASRRGPSR